MVKEEECEEGNEMKHDGDIMKLEGGCLVFKRKEREFWIGIEANVFLHYFRSLPGRFEVCVGFVQP